MKLQIIFLWGAAPRDISVCLPPGREADVRAADKENAA
jgi:hypothetical protein